MEAKFLGVQQVPFRLAAGSFGGTSAEGEKWRRGESEYAGLLKTRTLLKNREARNAQSVGIAPNWNVSGTRTLSQLRHFRGGKYSPRDGLRGSLLYGRAILLRRVRIVGPSLGGRNGSFPMRGSRGSSAGCARGHRRREAREAC